MQPRGIKHYPFQRVTLYLISRHLDCTINGFNSERLQMVICSADKEWVLVYSYIFLNFQEQMQHASFYY